MLKKSINHLTPTKLRTLLIGTIAFMLILGAGVFWFVRNQLVTYAEQVNKDTTAATVSSNDIAKLQQIQKQLEDDAVAVTRARNIVADSKSYEYQNQIIDDITAYAKKAGLQVMSFTFDDSGLASVPASGPSTATAEAQPKIVIPGLKSVSATVVVSNPVKYENVMRFIRSIELNLTKMQLTGVSISKAADNTSNVSVGPFIIEVYTR